MAGYSVLANIVFDSVCTPRSPPELIRTTADFTVALINRMLQKDSEDPLNRF